MCVLEGPQGETGVEGGVNGLNPGEGFLSQALRRQRQSESRGYPAAAIVVFDKT